PMGGLVVLDPHRVETGAVEEPAELLDIAEAQAGMALRQLGRRARANLRDGIAKQALHALPAGLGPPGEGNDTARPQRAHALGQRRFWEREMAEAEAAGYRVKGAVWKRQTLDLGNPELDIWMELAGKLDHSRRKVHRNDTPAAPVCLGCKET